MEILRGYDIWLQAPYDAPTDLDAEARPARVRWVWKPTPKETTTERTEK